MLSHKTMQRAALAAALIAAMPVMAHAQAFGGGGGDLLQPVITWFRTGFVHGLSIIAIMVIGFLALSGRIMWLLGVAIIGGILIVTNAETIAGAIGL